jgi:uncharacterized membrane protein YbaN (DUF454 family)
MKRAIFLICGWVCVAIALAGAMLPILPCTPFVLLAAACFARSSNKAMNRLRRMPVLGQALRDWHQHRGVRLPAKLTAIALAVSAPLITFWLNPQLSLAFAGSLLGGLVATVVVCRLPTVRSRPRPAMNKPHASTASPKKLARAA